MEENEEKKDIEPKEKKTAKRTTTKKTSSSTKKAGTTAKQATKKATTKKTTTKKATTKKETGTEKKTSSTTKKTVARTTKKKTAEPKEEKKIEKEVVEPEKETIVDRIINTEKEETETIEPKVEETAKIAKPKKTWLDEVELDKKKETLDNKKESKEEKKEEKPKFEKVTPKVEEKKTKHSFLKFLLVLIVIALILFIVHFFRNYMIFNSLLEKREALEKSTNHSYVKKTSEETLEYYYKDNTVILISQTAETKNMLWSDKNKNEIVGIDLKGLTATVSSGTLQEEAYGLVPYGICYDWNKISRMYDCAFWITSDIVDGTDCYKISWITGNDTAWYDKETGALMKTEEDGKVTEYTDWEFNKLKDEDMLRPNLIGFQVTNK